MKKFKSTKRHISLFFCALFLALACQEESIIDFESNKINQIEENEFNSPKTVEDLINSGYNFDAVSNGSKNSTKKISSNIVDEKGGVAYFTDESEFEANSCELPIEDFEEANIVVWSSYVVSPLNEFSDDGIFSVGDILPGVSISTNIALNRPGYEELVAREGIHGDQIMVTWSRSDPSYYHLIIEFNEDNINSVGMNIMRYGRAGNVKVNIIGLNDLFSTTTVYVPGRYYQTSSFFGARSVQPIKRISIIIENDGNGYDWEAIDNLTFGFCNGDIDGDGCNDAEDPIFSNMESTVNLDTCNTQVDNKMTDVCGIMMSDLIDELEGGSYANHGIFMKALGHLVNGWHDIGLITLEEKDLIVECAGESSIGHTKDLTFVPDDNFEQALIDLGYDTILDDYVLTSNISTITSLVIHSKGIFDLTGIQDFENLVWLNCGGNNLTRLELNNPALEHLSCWSNSLEILDLRKCPNLKELVCFNNQLTNLDVSNNLNLTSLDCQWNQLSSLKLGNKTSLTHLGCENNMLSSLNANGATDLIELECFGNKLTMLDVNGCINLEVLNCSENLLSKLNVDTNTELDELICNTNEIESLDLTNISELSLLHCYENRLTSLDVSNNNNLEELECEDNLLSCIQVNQNQLDNIPPYWYKDAGATYSTTCPIP